MSNNHRRQLRNFLLDRRYQLRYTVIMVLVSAMLTSALGYIWYRQVRETSKAIEVQALGNMAEADVRHLEQEIQQQDLLRLGVLVAFGVLVAVILAGYGIVLTHRVAGPLFKISRYMAAVREGSLAPIGDIRRGDQLREFFSLFRGMHEALRERAVHESEVLGTVLTALRQTEEPGAAGTAEREQALADLEALRHEKQRSLES